MLDNIKRKINWRLLGCSFPYKLIVMFMLLVGLGLGYYFAYVDSDHRDPADIINIFMLSATLLGPVALVFTLNGWKEQHNKQFDRDIAIKLWETLDEIGRLMFSINYGINTTSKAQKISLVDINGLKILNEEIASLTREFMSISQQFNLISLLKPNAQMEKIIIDYRCTQTEILEPMSRFVGSIWDKCVDYDYARDQLENGSYTPGLEAYERIQRSNAVKILGSIKLEDLVNVEYTPEQIEILLNILTDINLELKSFLKKDIRA